MAIIIPNAGDGIPSLVFTKEDIRIRSIRQTRSRISDIVNHITINYDYDPVTGEYGKSQLYKDDESIIKYGQKELVIDGNLFKTVETAGIHDYGNKLIELLSKPRTFTTFSAYLPAYIAEKIDLVYVETDYNDYVGLFGRVVTIQRIFGNANQNKINYYDITIDSKLANVVNIDLADSINISDSIDLYPTDVVIINIEETVNISETADAAVGEYHELDFVDDVDISEAVDANSISAIVISIFDQVRLSELVSIDRSDTIFINIAENVSIGDSIGTIEVSVGFGGGGFGDVPFGGSGGLTTVFFKESTVQFNGDIVTFN